MDKDCTFLQKFGIAAVHMRPSDPTERLPRTSLAVDILGLVPCHAVPENRNLGDPYGAEDVEHHVEKAAVGHLSQQRNLQHLRLSGSTVSHAMLLLHEALCQSGNQTYQISIRPLRYLIFATCVACYLQHVSKPA